MKWIEPNSIQWKQDPMMRDAFELSRPTRVFSFFHVIHMFANNYHTGLIWHRGRREIRLYFYYNTDYVGLYFVTCFLCFFFFFFSIPKFRFILMTAIDSDFKDEQNNIYSICTSIKNWLIKHRSKRSWGGTQYRRQVMTLSRSRAKSGRLLKNMWKTKWATGGIGH